MTDIANKKAYIQYSSERISSTLKSADHWQILFVTERLDENPNIEILFNSAINYLSTISTVLETDEALNLEKNQNSSLTSKKTKAMKDTIVALYNRIRVEIKKLDDPSLIGKSEVLKDNLENAIFITLDAFMGFKQSGKETKPLVEEKYKEILKKENYWNNLFLGSYIVGSLFLAIAFSLRIIRRRTIK